MTAKRKRIGPIETSIMSVAKENAAVYKELRRGRLEPSVASRLSQMLINQRAILEQGAFEARLATIEDAITAIASNVRPIMLKAS